MGAGAKQRKAKAASYYRLLAYRSLLVEEGSLELIRMRCCCCCYCDGRRNVVFMLR